MEFTGLKPIPRDVPVIDLNPVYGPYVDMYNCATILSIAIRKECLQFELATGDDRKVNLSFMGILGLEVTQPDDWMPEEYGDVDHLLWQLDGISPQMYMKTSGMHFSFNCSGVCLTIEGDAEICRHCGSRHGDD